MLHEFQLKNLKFFFSGLNAELFYVREGVVNEYAMSWTVKVPPDIHSIYFNWNALTKRPVSIDTINMHILT